MVKPMFKEAVGNLFTEVPEHPRSHVRGWALHWAESLGGIHVISKKDPIDKLDVLYFDHGVNSVPGQLNLFGGITDQIVDRLEQVVENKGLAIVSLDAQMPVDEYVDGLKKRLGQSSCSPRLTMNLIEEFEAKLKANVSQFILQEDLIKDTVCIGDSHSTSYAKAGQPVIRKNGMTLHGALSKKYFESIVSQFPDLTEVTLVAGSIDIRHHIGLAKDPAAALEDLVSDFVDVALNDQSGVRYELAAPLPVEFEGRRIPKTGWLNDRPFTGSLTDRQIWTDTFREMLELEASTYFDVIHPPVSWYFMDEEAYAKTFMELGSSVHVAPTHYRRHGKWA